MKLPFKNIKNRKLGFAVLFMLPLLVVGTAFAFVTGDFQTEAIKWVNNNCDGNVKKADATICYTYYKNGDQDTRLSSLEGSSGGGIPLFVYGESNVKYGPVVDNYSVQDYGMSFFYAPLNVVVPVHVAGPQATNYSLGYRIEPYYESSDCTGQAYLPGYNIGDLIPNANYLIHGPGTDFYMADNAATVAARSINSQKYFNTDTNSVECAVSGSSDVNQYLTINQVSFPYGATYVGPPRVRP